MSKEGIDLLANLAQRAILQAANDRAKAFTIGVVNQVFQQIYDNSHWPESSVIKEKWDATLAQIDVVIAKLGVALDAANFKVVDSINGSAIAFE